MIAVTKFCRKHFNPKKKNVYGIQRQKEMPAIQKEKKSQKYVIRFSISHFCQKAKPKEPA